jgi:hypothetical protein
MRQIFQQNLYGIILKVFVCIVTIFVTIKCQILYFVTVSIGLLLI